MTAYQEALRETLGHEGGYYDGSEARDPNPTNFGVTQETYDSWRRGRGLAPRPVLQITTAEVELIYRGYWTGASCDELPRLVALTVFDHSINAGPGTAVMMLQRAVGVAADGGFGPATRAAVASAVARHGDAGLADRVCWERMRHYVDLAKSERLRPNLLSWAHRVVRFRERYLRDGGSA